MLSFIDQLKIEKVKRWNILPMPSNSIVYFPISGTNSVYHLFKKAHNLGHPVPDALYQDESKTSLIGLRSFDDNIYFGENKSKLWEAFFNLDCVQKKRKKDTPINYVPDEANDVLFDCGFLTDGHMIGTHFYSFRRELLSSDKNEIQMLKRKADLSSVNKGIYTLEKEPTGLSNTEKDIVGIDPGVRDLITGVRSSNSTKSFSISNKTYSVWSGFEWCKKVELKNREDSNIQQIYDLLKSSKTVNLQEYFLYLISVTSTHKKIFHFMSHFRHRETKGYLYSNRQKALDYISDIVANQVTVNEPFPLAHRSTKNKRRKKRKRSRAKQSFAASKKRSIVAYGNADLRGTMKNHTSIPVKSTMIAIAKKSLVVLVDEYRTSVTCSNCHSTLENKHRRLKEGEEKYKSLIYCLKVCQTCLDGKRIWHRDVNAAINIKGIMMDYINSQYDIKSRHPSLCRGTPPAVIVPTATSS